MNDGAGNDAAGKVAAGGDAAFRHALEALRGDYPTPRGALLPILHLLQERRGHLTDEDLVLAGEITDLSPAEVLSVTSFYTMYRREAPGKYPMGVCRNIACWLGGNEELVECVRKEAGIGPGGSSEDGLFTLEEVECLGSCGSAPVLEIHGHYFENLTPDTVRTLIADLREGRRQLKAAVSLDGDRS